MSAPSEVIAAVRAGDAEKLRALVAGDPALASARDESGVSALLQARYRSRQDLVEVLLAARRELDIFEATAVGKAERVKDLLDREPVQARAWSADGFTALHLACFFRQEEIAKLLLEHGAEVGAAAKNAMKVTPLHSAAASARVSIVKLLLEHGAPVNAKQHGGWTALQEAGQLGDEEMVELLLKHGADPKMQSDDGRTAADMAKEKGNTELAAKLRNMCKA